MTNPVVGNNSKAWTGLVSAWVNSTGNCEDWSANSGTGGTYGITNSLTPSVIYKTSDYCSNKLYLYCAEQPLVLMTEPAIGQRTNVPTDVVVKLAFPNDIDEQTLNSYNLRLEQVVVSTKSGVSFKEVPSAIIVKNSREVEIDPFEDLEANKGYRVMESNIYNTAGNYEAGITWYFSTNIKVAGPKLVSRLVESVTATFTEVFPADTNTSSIKPESTVNLYKTSSTADDIDNDSHVTGGPLLIVPFVIETTKIMGGYSGRLCQYQN